MTQQRRFRIVNSRVDSVSRTAGIQVEVLKGISDKKSKTSMRRVVKPGSLSGTVQKAGVALLLSPDPFTDIAAVALLGGAYLLKKREPYGIASVFLEMRKATKELRFTV